MGKSRIPVPVKAPGDKEHESYITKDDTVYRLYNACTDFFFIFLLHFFGPEKAA